MPGRIPSSDIEVRSHNSATDILSAVEAVVSPKREREANIWLSHARKLAAQETANQTARGRHAQFWLSMWSTSITGKRKLEFILACTSNQIGPYPIFIYSHLPVANLTDSFLSSRMSLLASRLSELVSSSRVYSVFAPTKVTTAFASEWSSRTTAYLEPEPFYAAKFTSCNRKTLTPPRSSVPFGDYMRLAELSDASRAAVLCKEFADDSIFFPLSLADAQKEVQEMIRNQQLWVYYTVLPDGREYMASIVACTRTTNSVAAINKVYTAKNCRKRGCAEQLVRRVCEFWLLEQEKDSVVLYVAHDNIAAETVYHRVGFRGLMGCAADDVEDWLELGFIGTDRGHW